jgi:hypothetical protein
MGRLLSLSVFSGRNADFAYALVIIGLAFRLGLALEIEYLGSVK